MRDAVREHGPITPYDVVPFVYGQELSQLTAGWWLPETLCYLRHLEVGGHVRRAGEEPERWVITPG